MFNNPRQSSNRRRIYAKILVEPWTDYVKEAKRGNFSPLIAVEKMQSEGKI